MSVSIPTEATDAITPVSVTTNTLETAYQLIFTPGVRIAPVPYVPAFISI